MVKGEFDMLYLCAGEGGGGWGAMIVFVDKSTSLEGGRGQKKNPEMISGGLQKNERKK